MLRLQGASSLLTLHTLRVSTVAPCLGRPRALRGLLPSSRCSPGGAARTPGCGAQPADLHGRVAEQFSGASDGRSLRVFSALHPLSLFSW